MKFQKLGKYTLLEPIATSASAEIFLAVGKESDGIHNFIAIKQIPKTYSVNEDYMHSFLNSVRIFSQLSHPNIINITDYGGEKSNPYFAMEYVHGKTLLQIIHTLEKENRQLPIEHIVFILREIAKGLDYIHMASTSESEIPLNIIHKEMYPQNVLVGYNGDVKIFDFGIQKPEKKSDSEVIEAHKRKLGYLSPEEVLGETIDYRVDIYALGVIAWELLAGRRLFLSENGFEIMKKIKDGDVPDITPFVDPKYGDIINIVTVCLATDRSHRHQTGQHVVDALDAFMNTHFPEHSKETFSAYIKNLFLYYHDKSQDKLERFTRAVFGSVDNIDYSYSPEKEAKLTESVILVNSNGPIRTVSMKDLPGKQRKWWEYGTFIVITLITIFIIRIAFLNYFR